MSTDADLEAKFWKSLKPDRTAMLGLTGVDDGHARPMTAQLDSDEARRGPIYFFTSKDTELVQAMGGSHRAMRTFASKGHDLFASVQAVLRSTTIAPRSSGCGTRSSRPGTRAARTDPKLQLLRLDGEARADLAQRDQPARRHQDDARESIRRRTTRTRSPKCG